MTAEIPRQDGMDSRTVFGQASATITTIAPGTQAVGKSKITNHNLGSSLSQIVRKSGNNLRPLGQDKVMVVGLAVREMT